MRAIVQMEKMGFRFALDGDKVHYTHEGERPDPAEASAFLEYLRRHREKVVQFLRDRAELPAPAWVSQRVKLEDLPAFKEKWGLRTVSSEWPEGAGCPVVYLKEK